MEPTDQGQSSVSLVTPPISPKMQMKQTGEDESPPTVRCPCGVHEVIETSKYSMVH